MRGSIRGSALGEACENAGADKSATVAVKRLTARTVSTMACVSGFAALAWWPMLRALRIISLCLTVSVSLWLIAQGSYSRGGARVQDAQVAATEATSTTEEVPPALPETTVKGVDPGFIVVPQLKRQVEFWKRIYGQYDTRQALVHDSRYIDVVYEVLNQGNDETPKQFLRRQSAAKARWRTALMGLHRKPDRPDDWDEDERHVSRIFREVSEPNKYLNSAHRKRLRVQLGQKDRFKEGYQVSGRYLTMMEEAFKREGLPLELTRLPFVESSFNLKARSKVGASGIWQFMRSTGKLFLRINGGLDERNDPIRATEAAARLLKQNFESLGNWPLAVTAYNHGRMGLMRAVRQTGSNKLEDLLWNYHSRSFGFASSNFFACLLAAIDVERNADSYFGKLTRDPALRYYEVDLPQAIAVTEVDRYFKIGLSQIQDLNPGLSEAHWKGRERMPAGYRLRLPLAQDSTPERESQLFLVGYEQIPSVLKGPRVKTR